MMKFLILRLIIMISMAFCLSHWASADTAGKSVTKSSASKRYALIMIISWYQDSAITELKDADKDVSEMKNCLIALGYDAKQIVTMTSKEEKTSASYGTSANILKAASRLLKHITPEDTLLIFFVGHSFSLGDRQYIVTADTDTKSNEALEATSLPLAKLRGMMLDSKLQQVIFFINAARSEPDQSRRTGKSLYHDIIPEHPADTDLQLGILSVSSKVGDSWQYPNEWQGHLTYSLLEGLKGAAADEKGVITLQGLNEYLRQELEVWHKRNPREQELAFMTLQINDIRLGRLAPKTPKLLPSKGKQ